jgi:hypothetical protein
MMGRHLAPHHRFVVPVRSFTCSAMDSPAVRAPDFPDTLDWIHTGGRRLSLADFRGRVLLLDFWTYG